MVLQSVPSNKLSASPRAPSAAPHHNKVPRRVTVLPSPRGHGSLHLIKSDIDDATDVIDLGAPLRPRVPRSAAPAPVRRLYTPSPRLYPGATKAPRGPRSKRNGSARRKRVFRRPVPNSRLYRPAPRRPQPPALRPHAAWPPPPPAPRALDTASRAALRLLSARLAPPPSPPPPERRLVVRLPPRAMEAATRHSGSPECSEENEGSSAPSEFLAEFLSAIMRRQYAEALKYCRLILQYEPHNATARGFYPLLHHKLGLRAEETSSSEEVQPPHPLKNQRSKGDIGSQKNSSGSRASRSGRSGRSARWEETGEESSGSGWEESERSGASCSSLELDSSEADPLDDNGNVRAPAPPHTAAAPPPTTATGAACEVLNDNAAASLRRLRDHFARHVK